MVFRAYGASISAEVIRANIQRALSRARASYDTLRAQLRAFWLAVEPGDRAWAGGAWGLALACVAIIVYRALDLRSGKASLLALGIGLPLALALATGGGLLLILCARLLLALRLRFRFILASSLVLLMTNVFGGSMFERVMPALYVVVSASVAGATFSVLYHRRTQSTSRVRTLLAVAGLAGSLTAGLVGLRWLFSEGDDNAPLINAAAAGAPAQLDLPDPSEPGPLRLRRYTYGTGQSRARPEYSDHADLHSKPVDGTRWLKGWRGFDGWARKRMLHFGPSALPINGRVFVPEGKGPFPVVLFVHGAHPMSDPSDPGYDYLCAHLATHGFAGVAIDENFFNVGAWAELDGTLRGENAARAFVVLEHLKALKAWSATPGDPLSGKLDLDHVVLAGHSRGGEAVTLAALFNQLTHHPDDASISFSYGFGIRGVVALASTDGQYQPAGAQVALRDVDFLALQGSNDADVERWEAHQQYDRVKIAEGGDHFKAAVYVHRANHGQWNRVWGGYDKSRFPRRLYFNRKPLLPQAAQEKVARAFLTAFADASLRGDRRWLSFLRDPRVGRRYLPDTIFLSRYEDGATRWIARFDEDVDVTTATFPGAGIAAQGFAVWREQPPVPSAFWPAATNRSVYLGWGRKNPAARFDVTLPEAFDRDVLKPANALVFALADASDLPIDRKRARPPIDLDVELVDKAGHEARLPLSSERLLQTQIETDIWKLKLRMSPRREVIFQTFVMPFAHFIDGHPEFDLASLAAVRFVFDRTPARTVALDDIGIARR